MRRTNSLNSIFRASYLLKKGPGNDQSPLKDTGFISTVIIGILFKKLAKFCITHLGLHI